MKETSTTHDVLVALPHPEELLCLILQKTTHKVEIFFYFFIFLLERPACFSYYIVSAVFLGHTVTQFRNYPSGDERKR